MESSNITFISPQDCEGYKEDMCDQCGWLCKNIGIDPVTKKRISSEQV